MGKDYILVIDEGTTGTRAILFDKKFQIAEQSYEEFCQHTPAENMVEHDAEEIYDLSVKMCKNVIEKKGISAENIIGIGITNQRNTAVIWDKHTDGRPEVFAKTFWYRCPGKPSCAKVVKSFIFS